MVSQRPARFAARLFDLPDVGAEVGELDGAEGALLEAGEVEDADSMERTGHREPPRPCFADYNAARGGNHRKDVTEAALARPLALEFGELLDCAPLTGAETVLRQKVRHAPIEDFDHGSLGRAFVAGQKECSRRGAAPAATPALTIGLGLVGHEGSWYPLRVRRYPVLGTGPGRARWLAVLLACSRSVHLP